jgi:DivIVA domain-containing protein
MSLTPDDIVGYEFRQQRVRGYDIEQVDDLLDRLADQVERTDRELDDLRQRLRESEARLAAALETETALKRTFMTAQDAAERAVAEAREQADELRETAERAIDEQLARARDDARTIVANAQREARTELATVREHRAAVERRLAALRALEQRHRASLERHLRAQLAQLDELSEDEDAPGNAPVAPRPPAHGSARDPAPTPDPAPSDEPVPTAWLDAGSVAAPDDTDRDEPNRVGSAAEASGSTEEPTADDAPPVVDHGLTVRIRGAERTTGREQQLGSHPPSSGGDGEPHR